MWIVLCKSLLMLWELNVIRQGCGLTGSQAQGLPASETEVHGLRSQDYTYRSSAPELPDQDTYHLLQMQSEGQDSCRARCLCRRVCSRSTNKCLQAWLAIWDNM